MKKLLNRRIAIVAVAVIATVAFFSFKSGDDRNFQIAKNLDIFNAIVKEHLGSLYGILSGRRSE